MFNLQACKSSGHLDLNKQNLMMNQQPPGDGALWVLIADC